MAGTVAAVLGQSQTNELDDVLAGSGVRSQYMVQRHYKNIPLLLTHGI